MKNQSNFHFSVNFEHFKKIKKWMQKGMGNFWNTKLFRVAFLTNFWTKINFWRRNSSFESLLGHQNIEIRVVHNMTMSQWSKIQKRGDHFAVFSVSGRAIWGYQWIDLDLSCSYLFFRVRCGSYRFPNDHFRFYIFVIFPIKSFPILTRRRAKQK